MEAIECAKLGRMASPSETGSHTPAVSPLRRGEDAPTDAEKARLLLVYTGLCCAITWTNALASYYWLRAPLFLSGLWVAFGLSFLVANPLFRWTRDVRLASHCHIGAGVAAIATIAFFTGGLGSPTMFWIASPPLVVALLLGVRAVAAWTAVGLAATAVMALLETADLVPTSSVAADRIGANALQTQVGMLVLVYVVMSFFLRRMNASITLLGEKNREIDRMLSLVEDSELKYRSIFDSASYGIALLGDEVVDCNPRLAAFLGEQSDALGGKPLAVLERIRVLDGPTLPKAVARVREQHCGSSAALACRAGNVELEITLTGVEIGGERLVLLFAQDVTERNSLQAQLVQSSKLASLGELAAGVAHEINNPLQVIAGQQELLLRECRQVERVDPAGLSAIGDSVDRIRRIVDGLQVFSRASTPENVAFDLHETVDRSVSLVDGIYGAQGISIEVDLRATQPLVVGSAGRMQQVIMNLLTNARDAVKDASERRIRVETRDEEGAVVLRVSDSGVGIAPDLAQRLFDPFFTTKPVGEGTGLGLGISRSIVKEMDGTLELDSSCEHGTCFATRLPVAQEGAPRVPVSTEPDTVPQVSGRCLVVDDEPGVRRVLELLLQSLGLESVGAADGEEALEELSQGSFDYVFTDLTMPGMGGRELIERVCDMDTGDTRFIVVTGHLDRQAETDGQDFGPGVHGVLTKPFHRADLAALLSTRGSLEGPRTGA